MTPSVASRTLFLMRLTTMMSIRKMMVVKMTEMMQGTRAMERTLRGDFVQKRERDSTKVRKVRPVAIGWRTKAAVVVAEMVFSMDFANFLGNCEIFGYIYLDGISQIGGYIVVKGPAQVRGRAIGGSDSGDTDDAE